MLHTASFSQIFNKITDSPLSTEMGNNVSACWGDYDNDGDLDVFNCLFFPSVNNPLGNNLLYQNNCNGAFTKVSRIPGGLVTDGYHPGNSFWLDYDNDNDLDLYISSSLLYQNQGNGGFIKVTTSISPSSTTLGNPAFADYDNDGYLDVYFASNVSIHKNNHSGDWNVLNVSPFASEEGRGDACAWADYDNDGFMDIYVCNFKTYPYNGSPTNTNKLYHNNGNGTFTLDTLNPALTAPIGSYGCAWGDFDNDLDMDLWVNSPFFGQNDHLYKNNGNGTFIEILTSPLGTTNTVNQAGASWADYDNDGDIDFFVPSFGQNLLFDNDGAGNFTNNLTEPVVTDSIVESFGSAWADYDNDGDLDLYVVTSFGDPNDLLYRNDVYQNNVLGRNWLKLNLKGVISNADAVGARVYIKATINGISKWQMRELNANGNIAGESGGASSHVVHFGLGDATIIDSLKIVWPASNSIQIFTNVSPNRFVKVIENVNQLNDMEPCKADLPSSTPGFVSGKLYSDVNNNCVYDEGVDNPIANKPVQASPGNYYAFSDDSGNYTLQLPTGNYTVSLNNQNDIWKVNTCQTDSLFAVTVLIADTTKEKDFSLILARVIPCDGIANLTITSNGLEQANCIGSQLLTSPCPGSDHQYCAAINNSSSVPLPIGTILTMDFPDCFTIESLSINNGIPITTFPSVVPNANVNVATATLNITTLNAIPAGGTSNFCVVINPSTPCPAPYAITADFNAPGLLPNLVVNGDFNAGNTGFTSGYVFNCLFPLNGRYCVGMNANTWNPSLTGTGRGGTGNFLYADGATNLNTIWCQTLTVATNTTYNFSSWFNNVVRTNLNFPDANLSLVVNGVDIATTGPIPENPNVWINSNGNWCSDANTVANICIRPTTAALVSGWDYGIDDIEFREAVAAPVILTQNNSCSCDPNDKTVAPLGCGINGNISKNETLTYKIRFQNTGTGPAHNVVLRDLLDDDLDLNSFKLMATSHAITNIQIIPNNALIVSFIGIELPDSGSNFEASNGFITFSISPKVNLPDGTKIENQTGIYFDDNEVVLTEVTTNTLFDIPAPDANYTYQHSCTNAGVAYDFHYTGKTPDNASYTWNFMDASPAISQLVNPTNIVFNSLGYKFVTLTVSRNGCIETVTDSILVTSFIGVNNKVAICHNGRTLNVNANALPAHLNHGDCVGPCITQNSSFKTNEEQININSIEVLQNSEVHIIPNPASQEATLYVNTNMLYTSMLIELYNYSGQLITKLYETEIDEVQKNVELIVNTKELNTGIYFIKTTHDGKTEVTKMLIQR